MIATLAMSFCPASIPWMNSTYRLHRHSQSKTHTTIKNTKDAYAEPLECISTLICTPTSKRTGISCRMQRIHFVSFMQFRNHLKTDKHRTPANLQSRVAENVKQNLTSRSNTAQLRTACSTGTTGQNPVAERTLLPPLDLQTTQQA